MLLNEETLLISQNKGNSMRFYGKNTITSKSKCNPLEVSDYARTHPSRLGGSVGSVCRLFQILKILPEKRESVIINFV